MNNIDAAVQSIRYKGTTWDKAIEGLSPDEVAALATWYVHEKGVPNLAAREHLKPQWTGDACPNCGGFMVQTGSCKTCQAGCGYSSGGCG